jgi:hypothetical protein
MTRAGFPHSDILGSRFVCQLPEAYRRLQRPSSAPSAKASTLCPYKLDHKDHSKRCSRPLCSSQATTGTSTPTPAPTHTPMLAHQCVDGSTERYQPAATRAPPPPTGSDATRSDPERTTFRLFPQDPTACPANPQPQQPPFPPDPKVGVLGATSSKAGQQSMFHPRAPSPTRSAGTTGLDTTATPRQDDLMPDAP